MALHDGEDGGVSLAQAVGADVAEVGDGLFGGFADDAVQLVGAEAADGELGGEDGFGGGGGQFEGAAVLAAIAEDAG